MHTEREEWRENGNSRKEPVRNKVNKKQQEQINITKQTRHKRLKNKFFKKKKTNKHV